MASAEGSHEWRTEEIKDLCVTIASLRSADEAERFLAGQEWELALVERQVVDPDE